MTGSIDTPAGAIRVHRATVHDIAAIARVMLDAAQMPRSRGLRMWNWLDGPRCAEIIRKRIERDELYLAMLGDEPVGTIRIRWGDVESWGERGNDGLAGYVYSLSIVGRLRGMNIGAKLLDWAEQHSAAKNKRFVRLDCMIPNPRLCAHYQSLGFTEQGVVHFDDHSVQRFERTIRGNGQAST